MRSPFGLSLCGLGPCGLGPCGAALSAAALVALAAAPAHAIPAWARKYNMNCTGCHYPVVPRLNATGLAFKWAGYRMPNEIGDNQEVKKIEEYLAAQGIAQYVYAGTRGRGADVNGTSVPSASLYAAGPIGRYFGTFLQFERTPDEVDLVAQLNGVVGNEDTFGGLRIGTGHALLGGMVAGFDRPTGVLAPLPLSTPITAAVPFRFTADAVGLDGWVVLGARNRLGVQVLNSQLPAQPAGGTSVTRRDYVLSNQFIWGRHGDGVTTTAFLGQMTGVDSAASAVTSRYYRLAASANRWVRNVELGGGYVYGRDTRLPVGADLFARSRLTGNGYWASGLYAVPKSLVSVYTRFEGVRPQQGARVEDSPIIAGQRAGVEPSPRPATTRAVAARDPGADAGTDPLAALLAGGARRYVLGTVIPLNVPQYFRFTLEGFVLDPRPAGLPPRRGVTAEVQLNF